MIWSQSHATPPLHAELLAKSQERGFDMGSDLGIGTLLKTLCRSKPGGHFLELGTGMSLSLVWMLEGLDAQASLISIDNDPELMAIAETYFGAHPQLELICTDGSEWLKQYTGPAFDLIFADAWPGKYNTLEETLALLKPGGFYVIDDMLPEPNWPEGHLEKAQALIQTLENRSDLVLSKMDWSTGIFIASKI